MSNNEYDKRDLEHIKEMERYYAAVYESISMVNMARTLVNDKSSLTKYERAKIRKWLRAEFGGPEYFNEEEFDPEEFMEGRILSIEWTGRPPSGGNTRGYGNVPVANGEETYVYVQFAWGGPSYGLRALATPDRWSTDFSNLVFVYHDWFVGYEMDVPYAHRDDWYQMLESLLGWASWDDIFLTLTNNGEAMCHHCGDWHDNDEDGMCDECAGKLCSECGEEPDELLDTKIGKLCPECATYNKVCHNCGEQVGRYGELVGIADGSMVCEECAVEVYGLFQCDYCNKWLNVDDDGHNEVGVDTTKCEDCWNVVLSVDNEESEQ